MYLTRPTSIPRTILVLAANPINQPRLRLDEEVREIDEGLRRSKRRDCFKIEQRWAVGTDALRRALLDFEPQIVHFCGHGADEEGLILEDEVGQVKLVGTDALAKLFELCKEHVECVVLNACYSEKQSNAIAPHIGYVIGMSQAIGDKAAIKFAVGFYDALGAGRSVGDAYKFGCNAIQMESIPQYLIPILKTNPDAGSAYTRKKLQRQQIPLVNSIIHALKYQWSKELLIICIIIIIAGFIPWGTLDTCVFYVYNNYSFFVEQVDKMFGENQSSLLSDNKLKSYLISNFCTNFQFRLAFSFQSMLDFSSFQDYTFNAWEGNLPIVDTIRVPNYVIPISVASIPVLKWLNMSNTLQIKPFVYTILISYGIFHICALLVGLVYYKSTIHAGSIITLCALCFLLYRSKKII